MPVERFETFWPWLLWLCGSYSLSLAVYSTSWNATFRAVPRTAFQHRYSSEETDRPCKKPSCRQKISGPESPAVVVKKTPSSHASDHNSEAHCYEEVKRLESHSLGHVWRFLVITRIIILIRICELASQMNAIDRCRVEPIEADKHLEPGVLIRSDPSENRLGRAQDRKSENPELVAYDAFQDRGYHDAKYMTCTHFYHQKHRIRGRLVCCMYTVDDNLSGNR